MKLNKTLTQIKEGANIYGEKQLEKVFNFKAVSRIEENYPYIIIHLINGEIIHAYYSEIIY